MTPTSEKKSEKLIHAARCFVNGSWHYLFLRKESDNSFVWSMEDNAGEQATTVSGETVEEAMRLAARHWQKDSFTTVICGFRYTLPERDEHGINALFHQMVASYSSMNGVYYDEELGNNCFVQNASDEAIRLWKRKS
ncbi:MAG: hypothetical protein WCG42_05410 [Parachlamydiaceae bacterium]